MVITTSFGKLIVTAHELVVRIEGDQHIVMQAQTDAITLIGGGANVIAVVGSDSKWSVKLDSEDQLLQLSQQLGCEIR